MSQEVLEDVETTETEAGPPEDFAAYQAYRDAQEAGRTEAPAPGEEGTAPSVSAEEAGQTAEDSGTEEEAQQEDDVTPPEPKKNRGLQRRMRELTGEIGELRKRLASLQEGEAGEETSEEVASSPETEEQAAEAPLVRPKLADFEDTETQSAFEQWETALEAYQDAKQERTLKAALDKQKAELAQLEQQKAQRAANQAAQAAWNTAASRFPDYNEVVQNDQIKISGAMEVVMRRDPEAGTAIAYWLGKNPKESQRIADLTVANSDAEVPAVIAKAGLELGRILGKIEAAPAPKTPPAAGKTTPAAPAAKPPLKKVSTAHKPPTQLRPAGSPDKFDLYDDKAAADTTKWIAERNRQLAAKGKR